MKTTVSKTIPHLIALIQADEIATAQARKTLGYGEKDILSMPEVRRIISLSRKEWEALSEFVTTLSYDEKRNVCTIMLLGRGDFKTYEESLKHCETHSIDTASEYILGKTLKLEEYLRKGIAKL